MIFFNKSMKLGISFFQLNKEFEKFTSLNSKFSIGNKSTLSSVLLLNLKSFNLVVPLRISSVHRFACNFVIAVLLFFLPF